MKFHYMILLALIIFNSMLIITSSFFPATTHESGALDVVNESDYSAFKNLNNPGDVFNALFIHWSFGAILGTFGLIGGIGSILLRNVAPFAVCMALGLFIGLFMGVANVVWGLTDNPVITSILTIVFICIGIIITFDLVEALKGRQDV